MIKSINIKDFVLIEEAEINFSRGLNILTGETGAGKSIIIDAIDIALGASASKDKIRTGADKALIELNIEIDPDFPVEILEENETETEDNILTISAEIMQNKTRSRINGVLVQRNFIRSLRKYLADIHGQHDTYNCINPKTHIDFLDNYGKDEHNRLLQNYKQTFSGYISIQKELEIINSQNNADEQKIDFLKFRIEEITSAEIDDLNEYEELIHRRSVLLNAEELKDISYSGYDILYNQDSSIIDVLNTLKSKMFKASEFDDKLTEFGEIIESSSANLREVADELRNYSENLETDPQKLYEIDERIDLLDKIKRKYGPRLSDVLNNSEKFQAELDLINLNDEKSTELSKEIVIIKAAIEDSVEKLSVSRKKLSGELSELIRKKLVGLEMPKVKFLINLKSNEELSYKGKDSVEFLISPNTGEPLKPIAKIASGGEISRVMLAIKTVFAEADNVNTVIFDEIDSGISGNTSRAVAEALCELGLNHQIICITHQPIIAAAADRHLYIRKEQTENLTRIFTEELNHEEQINALALLADGSGKNPDSLKFAANLLDSAKLFKANFIKVNCI